MKYFFIFFFYLSANAVVCDQTMIQKESVHIIPGVTYWLQALDNCRIMYMKHDGTGNNFYNACTRKNENASRGLDPFPVPGGDLYIHAGMTTGISIFKTQDLISKNLQNSIYTDPQHVGTYQSVGLLKGSTSQIRNIRVAIGDHGGQFRDYRIEKKSDDYKVTPIQSKIVKVCENLNSKSIDTQIPILSRDGAMIAMRDLQTSNTKIFKILMPSARCEEVPIQIPGKTSKLSFSFDNKSVFFVIQDPKTNRGRLMQADLNSGKVKTLSSPNEDVMYMTTLPNGNIFYTRRPNSTNDGRFIYQVNESELVEINPSKLNVQVSQKIYEALGLMWGKSCHLELDLDYASAVGKRMNSETCDQIVSEDNLSSIQAYSKIISLNKLKSFCKKGLQKNELGSFKNPTRQNQ